MDDELEDLPCLQIKLEDMSAIVGVDKSRDLPKRGSVSSLSSGADEEKRRDKAEKADDVC